MKLLILADLHYNDYNYTSTGKKQEIEKISSNIDAVVLCGDNAEVDIDFEHHHKLFKFLRKKFNCPIGFVAGNHDLWTKEISIDSEKALYEIFPKIAKTYDLAYLETQTMGVDDFEVTGTYGHYDYSFFTPGEGLTMKDITEFQLKNPQMRELITYNDKRKMQKSIKDKDLTKRLITGLEDRLAAITGDKVITISHTIPSLACVSNNNEKVNSLRFRFLSAYSGTTLLKKTLERYSPRYHFCGHTHMPAQTNIGQTKVVNVGSEYKLLRHLILDTSTNKIKTREKLIENLSLIDTYQAQF